MKKNASLKSITSKISYIIRVVMQRHQKDFLRCCEVLNQRYYGITLLFNEIIYEMDISKILIALWQRSGSVLLRAQCKIFLNNKIRTFIIIIIDSRYKNCDVRRNKGCKLFQFIITKWLIFYSKYSSNKYKCDFRVTLVEIIFKHFIQTANSTIHHFKNLVMCVE